MASKTNSKAHAPTAHYRVSSTFTRSGSCSWGDSAAVRLAARMLRCCAPNPAVYRNGEFLSIGALIQSNASGHRHAEAGCLPPMFAMRHQHSALRSTEQIDLGADVLYIGSLNVRIA